jgi:adenylate kinase
MMRQECRSGSPLGAQVESLLASGQLVADELIEEVVSRRLAQPDCARGFILDGFPRTAAQAHFLDQLLAKLRFDPPVVFNLTIVPEELIARLGSRRECPSCNRTFHVTPGDPINCPHDGSTLVFRDDDQPATIRHRLAVYAEHTSELLRYYHTRGYHSINASRPVDDIASDVLSVLRPDPNGTKDLKLPVLAAQHLCAPNTVAH